MARTARRHAVAGQRGRRATSAASGRNGRRAGAVRRLTAAIGWRHHIPATVGEQENTVIDFDMRRGHRGAMTRNLFVAALVALVGLTAPALAQQATLWHVADGDGDGDDGNNDDDSDDDDDDDANGNGIPDDNESGSISADRMEAECQATARPEICLSYFQFNCQYYGFPLACAMANLGGNCYGGDPGQCQYFVGLMQANSACIFGDQSACAYIMQQPIMRQ
ncbi:MAG: hypothetical protein R3F55_15850 [Alphaproteobacteria bacterium]